MKKYGKFQTYENITYNSQINFQFEIERGTILKSAVYHMQYLKEN